eukprot:scpid14210/ scgid17295/ 
MAFSAAQRDSIAEIVAASVAAALGNSPPAGHHAADSETGANGMFPDVMHHTPACIAHVAPEAIDKIKRIEYVDIACLLPPKPGPAAEPTPKRFRVDDDGALAVCAAPKRKIENLATWIEAWSIFSLIAIGEHHLCAEALMIHQLRIIQAAGKYRFAAVVEFDTRARQALSKDLSRSLADLDTELYTTCFTGQALPFCNNCKRLGHLTASCTTQPFRSRPKEQGVSSSAKPNETCRRYNYGTCVGSCKFRHACMFCSGEHPASACPAKK